MNSQTNKNFINSSYVYPIPLPTGMLGMLHDKDATKVTYKKYGRWYRNSNFFHVKDQCGSFVPLWLSDDF